MRPCAAFCNFLALMLKKALDDRIAALGRAGSWPEIIAHLDSLTETEIEHDGKRFVARSPSRRQLATTVATSEAAIEHRRPGGALLETPVRSAARAAYSAA